MNRELRLLALYPDTVDTLAPAQPAAGLVTAADIGDDREIWLYPCSGTPGQQAVQVELGGSLRYTRTAVAFATAGATWNGAAVSFTVAGGWATADVVGPGTLAIAGAPLLQVDGGAAGRRLHLKIKT